MYSVPKFLHSLSYNTHNKIIYRQIKTLYKTKIKLCHELGVPFGTIPDIRHVDPNIWTRTKLENKILAQTDDCGIILWSNIFYRYKFMAFRFPRLHFEQQQEAMDRGFKLLRITNTIHRQHFKYKNKLLIKMK